MTTTSSGYVWRFILVLVPLSLGCEAAPAARPSSETASKEPEYDELPSKPVPFTASTNQVTEDAVIEVTTRKEPIPKPEHFLTDVNARLEDFVGVWEGWWDNRWRVRFELSLAKNRRQLVGTYYWEEYVGKPMQSCRLGGGMAGEFLQLNRCMDLKLSAADPSKVLAVGRFPNNSTRTALLRKHLNAP